MQARTCSNFNLTTLRLARQKVQTVVVHKLGELNKCAQSYTKKGTTTKRNE